MRSETDDTRSGTPARRRATWRAVFFAMAVVLFGVPIPLYGVGCLGFSGRLGDTSVAENRAAAVGALALSLIPNALAVGCLWLARRLRPLPGTCPACGYERRDESEYCPECGSRRAPNSHQEVES